jgi:hypothetical protein
MGRRRLAYPYRLYLDTFMLPYGGDDGTSQWHFHRGSEYSSLVVCRRENRKTFFEIDKEFESMMAVVKNNFVTVDTFLLYMRASLRQTLIPKLVHVNLLIKSHG